MTHLCQQAGLESQFEISSAAVSTEEIGNDIYPPAKNKLREKGVPFTHRAARRITLAEFDSYDLIICADRSNLRWLERIVGAFSQQTTQLVTNQGQPAKIFPKVSLMMAWLQEMNIQPLSVDSNLQVANGDATDAPDVSDPWYTGDFETTYKDILSACQNILQQVQ